MNESTVVGWQASKESLEQARRAVKVELVPVKLLEGGYETAAFEVAVNGVISGRWWRTKSKGCEVTWQAGIGVRAISVPDNGDDPDQIMAAIRPTTPPMRFLRPGEASALSMLSYRGRALIIAQDDHPASSEKIELRRPARCVTMIYLWGSAELIGYAAPATLASRGF